MGLLYRGKRERPLSRAERRQLVVLAVATVVGLVATLVGLLVGPIGGNRLSPVLMQGGTLVVVAAGFFSMRRLVSARRRWFQVAVVATLALLCWSPSSAPSATGRGDLLARRPRPEAGEGNRTGVTSLEGASRYSVQPGWTDGAGQGPLRTDRC